MLFRASNHRSLALLLIFAYLKQRVPAGSRILENFSGAPEKWRKLNKSKNFFVVLSKLLLFNSKDQILQELA